MTESARRLPAARIAPDLVVGGVAALVLLAAVPGGDRLTPAPVAVTLVVYLAIAAAAARFWPGDRRDFGWPNRVTLLRASLVAVLAGALVRPGAVTDDSAVLAAIALLALALDGVDGWLARWLDRVTRFGARFDMEVDALLILLLSVAVWWSGKAGPWVLAIGLMRYGFLLAGRFRVELTGPLDERRWRKVVCVLQGLLLALSLLPVVTAAWANALLAFALGALTASFARDIHFLLRSSDGPEANPDDSCNDRARRPGERPVERSTGQSAGQSTERSVNQQDHPSGDLR